MTTSNISHLQEESSSRDQRSSARRDALFREHLSNVYMRRDRVFTWLMAAQWLFGIILALVYSPHAWVGKVHSTHLHVYYAILLGGAISGPVIALTRLRPGWVVTRHAVAVAQMMWSALLIHLTGGRIETHFHVFGSLAFLAFYRDWKVLITATLVVAGDHLLRGLLWPESVYGITNPEWWRFLEHAFWVVFENVVLVMGIVENRREMKALAARQTDMESLNSTIELKVIERTQELEASREQYRALVETTQTVPWQMDPVTREFVYVGPQAQRLLNCPIEDWAQAGFLEDRLHPDDREEALEQFKTTLGAGGHRDIEFRMRHEDGSWVWVRTIISETGADAQLRGIMLDITERRQLEIDLRQAQKLESVGRLASGVAHEINTPIQFVSDSMYFLREAFTDTQGLIEEYKSLRAAASSGSVPQEVLDGIEAAEQQADLAYLEENVPKAFERSRDGLDRVAAIVRSMKEFAHPDQKVRVDADINRALTTTLTIARNEYKYVANVETDFEELPTVPCHAGELNQAFLNIVVNAAQAIAEMVKGTDQKGLIRITTRHEGDEVTIAIADTGPGIPESIRGQIFDPFFTTKDVGKGSGQGLAIARSVIVDKHDGGLTVESEVGRGTTFLIRLPIRHEAREPAAA